MGLISRVSSRTYSIPKKKNRKNIMNQRPKNKRILTVSNSENSQHSNSIAIPRGPKLAPERSFSQSTVVNKNNNTTQNLSQKYQVTKNNYCQFIINLFNYTSQGKNLSNTSYDIHNSSNLHLAENGQKSKFDKILLEWLTFDQVQVYTSLINCLYKYVLIKLLKTNETLATRIRELISKIFLDKILVEFQGSQIASLQNKHEDDGADVDDEHCRFDHADQNNNTSKMLEHEKTDLFGEFIKHLTEVLLYSKMSNVRQRSLELLNLILDKIKTDKHQKLIEPNLYENVAKHVMPRLTDTNSSIRILAIKTLARLQEPNEPSCEIIEAFILRATSDPIISVKVAALEKVRYTEKSVAAIYPLLKDRSEQVQSAAFGFFNKRVTNFKKLKFKIRLNVVKLGLQMVEQVRNDPLGQGSSEQFQLLMQKWLDSIKLYDDDEHVGNKIPRLVRYFDIEENPETCQKLVSYLHKIINENDKTIIQHITSVDSVSLLLDEAYCQKIEYVFYWQNIFAHPFVPRLEKFLNFIQKTTVSYLSKLSNNLTDDYDGTDTELKQRTKLEFNLMNYLKMLLNYNFLKKSDALEVWDFLRNCLKSIFFTGITEKLWPVIGELVKKLFINDDERLLSCSEFVNDLLEEFQALQRKNDPEINHDQETSITITDKDDYFSEITNLKMQLLELEDNLENLKGQDFALQDSNGLDISSADDENTKRLKISSAIQALKSQMNKTSRSNCKIVVRLLHQIVEFICQTVSNIDYNKDKRNSMSLRIIEQWSKEIVSLSLDYSKTANFDCFELAVYKAFSLIGSFSEKVAAQALTIFLAYLNDPCNQSHFTENLSKEQPIAEVIIDGISDFLSAHEIQELVDFDLPFVRDLAPGVNEVSPQEHFLKQYSFLLYKIFRLCEDSDDKIGVKSLSAIMKLFLSGILVSNVKLFTDLLIYMACSEPDGSEAEHDSLFSSPTNKKSTFNQMLTLFFKSLLSEKQLQINYLVTPLIQIIKVAERFRNKSIRKSITTNGVSKIFDIKQFLSIIVNLLTETDLHEKMFLIIFNNFDEIQAENAVFIIDALKLQDPLESLGQPDDQDVDEMGRQKVSSLKIVEKLKKLKGTVRGDKNLAGKFKKIIDKYEKCLE